jgi:vacuolar protein sorting-associated protein 13A/C
VATISDSPLSFKELVIVNIYSTTSNLIMTLTKNYTRQGVLQFYKLIGSSDLLGNPVGLIDKLGTGVFEFFNEPRKGLLKGPKEFVGGVGKGVKSLLTNVVSGSFDSVSKITGSLYGVLKNVSGNTVNEQEMALKKPEHAFDGIYLGLKGGATELAEGVTGLFTKPFKRAKEEGAVGFFKGLGAGAIGLVASPFAATLRLGNNLATGIKNSAIRIGKGKIPTYGRFRHPRYFNSKNILQPYDEVLAEANEILKTVKSGRFSNSSILHLADFSAKRHSTAGTGLVIITDTYILYVEDCKHVRFKCPVRSVIRCEVYEERSTQEKQGKVAGEG